LFNYVAGNFDHYDYRGLHSGNCLFRMDSAPHIESHLRQTRPEILRTAWFRDKQSQMAAGVRIVEWQENQDGVYAGSVGLFGWPETT
jgi:hypothetical protein